MGTGADRESAAYLSRSSQAGRGEAEKRTEWITEREREREREEGERLMGEQSCFPPFAAWPPQAGVTSSSSLAI